MGVLWGWLVYFLGHWRVNMPVFGAKQKG